MYRVHERLPKNNTLLQLCFQHPHAVDFCLPSSSLGGLPGSFGVHVRMHVVMTMVMVMVVVVVVVMMMMMMMLVVVVTTSDDV